MHMCKWPLTFYSTIPSRIEFAMDVTILLTIEELTNVGTLLNPMKESEHQETSRCPFIHAISKPNKQKGNIMRTSRHHQLSKI